MNTDDKMMLLVSDASGVYIPKIFAESANREKFFIDGKPIPSSEWDTLMLDPYGEDSSELWDTWQYTFLDRAYAVDDNGDKWALYQDGDLWLIHESFTETEWQERFSY